MNTEYWLSEARLLEPYDLVNFASSVLQILFSTPREENWGFTLPFYSVQDCSLWNRLFFFVFFRRAEESAKRGVEGELRASRAPPLTRACLRSPEKRQKTTTITTTTTCKIRRNGRKLEKTTKSVAWRCVV